MVQAILLLQGKFLELATSSERGVGGAAPGLVPLLSSWFDWASQQAGGSVCQNGILTRDSSGLESPRKQSSVRFPSLVAGGAALVSCS